MNAAEKAEALASIRQDLGGLGLGLVLGAVACYFVRPKNRATNALEMAQRWLAWGLLGSVSSGVSFWVRNYDKGGILGAAITILFFSGLAWGVGYVWGRIKFGNTTRQAATDLTNGPKPLSSAAFVGAVGALILVAVALSALRGGSRQGSNEVATGSDKNGDMDDRQEADLAWAIMPLDTVEGIRRLQNAAKGGSLEAQAALATSYFLGVGVDYDFEQYVRLKNEVTGGDAKLEEQFHSEVFERIERAAINGIAAAQLFYGETLVDSSEQEPFTLNPRSVSAKDDDAKQAQDGVAWIRKAAEKGLDRAQMRMAELHEKGKGVPKDLEESFRWLLKAAEQGNRVAERKVGTYLSSGEGVSKSQTQATEWWLRSARKGDAAAAGLVGLAYKEGLGVIKDTKAALAWMYLAKANDDNLIEEGQRTIRDVITTLEAMLGPEGALQAQELAKTLVPKTTETAANN